MDIDTYFFAVSYRHSTVHQQFKSNFSTFISNTLTCIIYILIRVPIVVCNDGWACLSSSHLFTFLHTTWLFICVYKRTMCLSASVNNFKYKYINFIYMTCFRAFLCHWMGFAVEILLSGSWVNFPLNDFKLKSSNAHQTSSTDLQSVALLIVFMAVLQMFQYKTDI